MLPKANRLRQEKDIQTVLRRGRSFFHPLFAVKSYTAQSSLPRLAITVSTKVSKRAVKRNRIRRVLREAIKARWPKVKPYDILISVKPGVLKIAETQAVSELIKFLEQIKIIQ